MTNSNLNELHSVAVNSPENQAGEAYNGHSAPEAERSEIILNPRPEFVPTPLKPESVLINGGTSEKPVQAEVKPVAPQAEVYPQKPKAVVATTVASLTDGNPHFEGGIDPFLTRVTPKSIRQSSVWAQIWNIVSKPR